MNEETKVETPNFEGEKMKMPENSSVTLETANTESNVINKPLLVTLTVLLILILAGMYLWFSALTNSTVEIVPAPERPTAEENNEPESTTAEAQTETLNTVSTSDELTAIEADLEASNMESLDAEINAIEAELETDFTVQ